MARTAENARLRVVYLSLVAVLRTEQFLGCVADPVIEVGLSAHEDELGHFGLFEMFSHRGHDGLRNLIAVGSTKHIGQLEGRSHPFIEQFRPPVTMFETVDLLVGNTSSSRRDNMRVASSGTGVNDRAPQEHELFQRGVDGAIIAP